MREADKAFYKRRKREELNKARAATDAALRSLHLRWAELYDARLNGEPKAKIAPIERSLLDSTAHGRAAAEGEAKIAKSALQLAA